MIMILGPKSRAGGIVSSGTLNTKKKNVTRLSEPVVTVPTLKGEEKNKTCCKATKPHSGEDFDDLSSSPLFPPLCQVRQKKV